MKLIWRWRSVRRRRRRRRRRLLGRHGAVVEREQLEVETRAVLVQLEHGERDLLALVVAVPFDNRDVALAVLPAVDNTLDLLVPLVVFA